MTQISFTTVTTSKEEEEVEEEFEEKSSLGGVERPHPEAPGEITRRHSWKILETSGGRWTGHVFKIPNRQYAAA